MLRVGFIGVRTDDVAGVTRFFTDLLGLEAARIDADVAAVRLPTHPLEYVGIFSRDYRDDRRLPNDVDFMVAFVVDDLDEALAEVKAAGLPVVAPGPEVVRAADEFGPADERAGKAWFYVRAPDRRVYGFMQV